MHDSARASFSRIGISCSCSCSAKRYSYSRHGERIGRPSVGEMCGILVLDEPGARLTVRCSATDAEVTVEASREPASPTITVGELSDQILRAVVDTFAVDPDEARVTITKHRQG